jgi:hypothetical protein
MRRYKLSLPSRSFCECWEAYRAMLPKKFGGQSKRDDVSPVALWSLSSELKNSYMWLMQAIALPEAYAALSVHARMVTCKRQIILELTGFMSDVPVGKRLSYEQVERFADMARKRYRRLLCPQFKPSLSQRLLTALRLFRFSGDERTLAAEDVAVLALAGSITGQSCGNRSQIGKVNGVPKVAKPGLGGALQKVGLFTYRPARMRHPMLPRLGILRKLYHRHLTGGQVFVRLSNVLYGWTGNEFLGSKSA